MPTKTRIIIVSILILFGGALFSYCMFFYPPIEIATQAKGGSTTVTGAEAAPVKEISTGGPERDKSDQPNQSRPERRPRPKAGAI